MLKINVLLLLFKKIILKNNLNNQEYPNKKFENWRPNIQLKIIELS